MSQRLWFFTQSLHPSLWVWSCIPAYDNKYIYIYILGLFAPTVFKIALRRSRCRCHVLREVLVVVLVTSSAFSQTKCRSNEADFVPLHWRRRWQDYTSRSTLSSVTRAGAWGEGRSPSVVTRPLGGSVFHPNRCAPAGCSLSLLLLLPVSHCDVPQQGLLGELVLIQQQIQRHEEEVRRAAAANNARPPPAEPAPVPPQQKRKVKVTTHLDKPVIHPATKEKISPAESFRYFQTSIYFFNTLR